MADQKPKQQRMRTSKKPSLTQSFLNATFKSNTSKNSNTNRKLTRQKKTLEHARPESRAKRRLAVITAQTGNKKVKIFSDKAESDRSKSRENKRYEGSACSSEDSD